MAEELHEELLFSAFDGVAEKPINCSLHQDKYSGNSFSLELKTLQNENARLRRLINKLLLPVGQNVNTKEKPFFHAVFFNSEKSIEGRQKLEYFVQTLSVVGSESVNEQLLSSHKSEPLSVCSLQPSLSSLNECVNANDWNKSTENSKDVLRHAPLLNCAQYFDIYCIDVCGLPVANYTSGCNEGWEIPLYEQVFFTAVPFETDNSSKIKVKRKKACFNCGSVTHNLSECAEPQNLARIDSMRQQFIKKFTSPFAKDKRYHLDEKRFGNFKPGIISSNLREALGIRSDELPCHIYKMRLLGYPPGYLPSTSNSTLLLYNADGHIEDYVMEDLDEDDGKTRESAFVKYPGFNCPVPKGIRDKCRELGYPHLSPHQSINEMDRWHRSRLEQIDVSRQTKSTKKRQWADSAAVDMELDDDDNQSSGWIIPTDVVQTERKRRKYYESDTTDEGGYSPTHPNIQHGTTEKILLAKIHHVSSSKHHILSSSSCNINKTPSPIPCELMDKTAKINRKLSKAERFNEKNITSPSPEEGEIVSDEEDCVNMKSEEEQESCDELEAKINQGWWLGVPLASANVKPKPFSPPPLPPVKLPMDLLTRFYTSSTVLQRVSFEDRIMWLDPIYGNIQVSTGRYNKLKEILHQKKDLKKRKSR